MTCSIFSIKSNFSLSSFRDLTYDAYKETLENQKEKEDEFKTMKDQFNTMQSQLQTLLSILSSTGQEGKQEIAKKLIEQGTYKAKSDIINKQVIL